MYVSFKSDTATHLAIKRVRSGGEIPCRRCDARRSLTSVNRRYRRSVSAEWLREPRHCCFLPPRINCAMLSTRNRPPLLEQSVNEEESQDARRHQLFKSQFFSQTRRRYGWLRGGGVRSLLLSAKSSDITAVVTPVCALAADGTQTS